MNYKSLRVVALRYKQLASTRSEHYQQIEAWCEFADALMTRLDWPETLWEPSPLHAGDLSPFFRQEIVIKPVVATMHVRVDVSHDSVDVGFEIKSNSNGSFSVMIADTVLWKSNEKQLSLEALKKAHDHILKRFQAKAAERC